jgi:hypothetical protein
MALTTTTLASACGLNDRSIVVSSATGFAAGYKVLIDGEEMEVTKDYVSGTTVGVLRGRGGTPQAAHVTTANVTVGAGSDFQNPAPGAFATTYGAVPTVYFTSVTATSTLALPPPRSWSFITMNGTSAITLTVPVPTKDMDGTVLFLISNGVAQHIYTFTSGLGGVGSGYTTVTPASAARGSMMVVACNGYWNAISGPGWSGTVTKVTCALA